MAVNNSLLNQVIPRVSKEVEVPRTTIFSAEHAPADQPRFRDTLKSIEQSVSFDRAKKSTAKVQKNRDAQQELHQKNTAQKSKFNSTDALQQGANTEKNQKLKAEKIDKEEVSSQPNHKDRRVSKDSEDNKILLQDMSDETNLSATEIDSQNIVSPQSPDEVSCAEIQSNMIAPTELMGGESNFMLNNNKLTGGLEAQDEANSENLVGVSLNLSDETSVEEDRNLPKAVTAASFYSKNPLNEMSGAEESGLSESLDKEQSNNLVKQLDPSKETVDQNQNLLDTSATMTRPIEFGAMQQSPAEPVFDARVTDSDQKAESDLSEMIKASGDMLSGHSAQKTLNNIQPKLHIKGDTTQGGTGVLSNENTASFKSLLSEMKVESSTLTDAIDSLITNDKTLPESTKSPVSNNAFSVLQNALSSEASTRGFVVKTAVEVPVGQPQWSQAVGDKVLWLAAQNVTSAELHLHPQDLGPMQVKVSIGHDQITQVSFTSQHAQVREILDQNLQRLKEMFAEQGMHSVQVDVSDRSSQRQAQEQRSKFNHGNSAERDEEPVVAVSNIQIKRLVDHYA